MANVLYRVAVFFGKQLNSTTGHSEADRFKPWILGVSARKSPFNLTSD